MNIVNWFDVNNLSHIEAYSILQNSGTWPKNFIPEGMEFPSQWSYRLVCKIADAYIDEKLQNPSGGNAGTVNKDKRKK